MRTNEPLGGQVASNSSAAPLEEQRSMAIKFTRPVIVTCFKKVLVCRLFGCESKSLPEFTVHTETH